MSDNKPFKFKFFLPDARLLERDEIRDLEKEMPDSVDAAESEGLWIEINCPDRSCLDEQGQLTLPATEQAHETEGVFLNLFCPEGRCQVTQSTDIV
jgi:hypothetical protein